MFTFRMEDCKSIQSKPSSSTPPKYDVFVSFRGDDVRNTFADHLFAAFKRKAIVAFRDDTNLKQGDHISTELMQAIEGSQVLIVVFSKNYATSSWCLQELAKIVDCGNMEVPTGQSLLPVFYDVSPSEVRKQSGDYGKALAEHEERFKPELVQEWRKTLTQVANLSGWDIQNKGPNIIMHDKLGELGMKIVRQKTPNEPGKWSRLWLVEDFHNLMYSNMAMDNLEAITLPPLSQPNKRATMRAEALSKMNRLRYLYISNDYFSGSLNHLSNELRYLYWYDYPFTYFPSSCELNKLVELHLPGSSIKQLWEGTKPMYNLKVMDLKLSKNLVKTPDFGGSPNLEQLDLSGCTELVDIHPSIGNLKRLVYLDLNACRSLTSLSNNISCVSSLEVVTLNGCSKLFHSELQENARHGISDGATPSIYERLKLMLPSHFMKYRRQDDVVDSLKPSSLSRLQCLIMLDLSYCNLVSIPDVMAELCCLERLDLAGNEFVTLPSFMMDLPRLIWLKLDHCKQLTSLSKFPLHTALPTQRDFVWWKIGAGLKMFNCPKLVEMGRSWISIAFSWMMQFLKVHKESSPLIKIVIPGTGTDEIPSWFNCQSQSVGDSIRLEPTPRVDDSNWVGVALCAAFVAQYHPPTTSDYARATISCECRRGRYTSVCSSFVARFIKERDGVTDELVHLSLVYFPRQKLTSSVKGRGMHDVNGLRFNFYFTGKHVKVEVKHWGVRTVYKKDLEELNALHPHHPQPLAP